MSILISMTLVLALFVSAQQCGKDQIQDSSPETTPACVQAKINEIAADRVWNPPAKVYSYVYNGQQVYYITSRCCDIPSQLYDAECNLFCRPDGGYTGKGDGACADFFAERKNEKLLWEDEREP